MTEVIIMSAVYIGYVIGRLVYETPKIGLNCPSCGTKGEQYPNIIRKDGRLTQMKCPNCSAWWADSIVKHQSDNY